MENKMEEISSQRKLEALEENGTLIRKRFGKTFLQLDCENAKELSMKWGEKAVSVYENREKVDFGTAIFYACELCADLCRRSGGSQPGASHRTWLRSSSV